MVSFHNKIKHNHVALDLMKKISMCCETVKLTKRIFKLKDDKVLKII